MFIQSTHSSLYLAGDQFAFVTPSPGASSLALAESWATDGCYFFTASPITDPAAFTAAALHFMATNPGARIAWVNNTFDATLLGIDADSKTDRVTLFTFGSLTLLVGRGCTVSLTADGFSLAPATQLALLTPDARFNTASQPLTITADGILQTAFELTVGDFNHLGVEMRMFFADSRYPVSESEYFVNFQRYPVFKADATPLSLFTHLDPLHPLDHERTFFSFANNPPNMPSHYRTTLGYTIHLKPVDQDSRLVFAAATGAQASPNGTPIYLVPAGDFEMSVPAYGDNAIPQYVDLLCGLSGVEYVKIEAQGGSRLHFNPDGSAYAPAFIPRQSLAAFLRTTGIEGLNKATIELLEQNFDSVESLVQASAPIIAAIDGIDDGLAERIVAWFQEPANQIALANVRTFPRSYRKKSGGEPLKNQAATAWATVRQSATLPIYYTQPDQAVLYQVFPGTLPDVRADFLHYMEVPSTGLPARTDNIFPLLPYGGVSSTNQPAFQQLELEVVSPTRRARIEAIPGKDDTALPGRANNALGTTPQGLRAQFSSDFNDWESLILAHDTAGKDVQFVNIGRSDPIRDALQANQMFLVITDPDALKKHFTNSDESSPINQLTIAGWAFDLDPASWKKNGTVLIFKFYDKAMVDLLEDTSMWSLGNEFNAQDAGSARRRVSRLIQDALAKSPETESATVSPKDRDNYQKLAYAARTRSWSGIIALNVAVPPDNFPDDLKALVTGFYSPFYAQYIGIEMTPVKASEQGLVVENSSLFGLIDYVDASTPPPNDSGYSFRVMNLSVLFLNSLIKDFACEIALTIDKLFEEPTTLLGRPPEQPRNDLILKGRYESHGGKSSYSFTYSGSTGQRPGAVLQMPESRIFNDVEILKAQFNTSPSSGDDVSSRFIFWGRINFKYDPEKDKNFDILSFGAEPDSEAVSENFLSFANLALDMQFTILSDDEVAKPPVFTFDASRMTFDRDKSKSRQQSLYSKFPLKLTGILTGDGATSPDSFGFMPVKTPGGGKVPKDSLWYGLTFDLELGSAGSLAGKAGIVVTVLAAWQPGGGVYTGLKLPGSTGGKREISLMGVLKLVFKRIEFTASRTENVTYILKLKDVMLKLLVLSLPPNGKTEIIIFGDPQGTQENNTLAWYAAYAKNLPPTVPPKQPDMFAPPKKS